MSTVKVSTPRDGGLTGAERLGAMSAVLARNWWLIALRGVFAILFGLMTAIAPAATLLTLVVFFAAYMLIDGVAGIVAAVRAAGRHERWVLLLAEGLLNILVGVAAFLLPGSAVLAFVLITAAWAIVTGALLVVAAFRLHVHYGRWWLALGGVASLLFGLLLVVNPGVGAYVLTLQFAGYAMAFGVMLLVLAFQLRARRADAAASPPGPGLGQPV